MNGLNKKKLLDALHKGIVTVTFTKVSDGSEQDRSRWNAVSPVPVHSPVPSRRALAYLPANGESARSVKRIASRGKRAMMLLWDSRNWRAQASATRRSL